VRFNEAFEGREYISAKVLRWLNKLELASEAGMITLKRYMEDLTYQRAQLLELTQELRRLIENRYQQNYKCLISVPGIGPITAIALLAEIGDFNRFDSPAEFCSFIGLIPWENSSGENIYTRGIQPRCNKHLRPLIIEASWIAIRKDPQLLKYYRRHAIKNSKHAIVKVARKLALTAKSVGQNMTLYQSDYYLKDETLKSSN
jgi:transposase